MREFKFKKGDVVVDRRGRTKDRVYTVNGTYESFFTSVEMGFQYTMTYSYYELLYSADVIDSPLFKLIKED